MRSKRLHLVEGWGASLGSLDSVVAWMRRVLRRLLQIDPRSGVVAAHGHLPLANLVTCVILRGLFSGCWDAPWGDIGA